MTASRWANATISSSRLAADTSTPPTQLTADQGVDLLRPIWAVAMGERTGKDLARDMIAELPGIDARLKASAAHLPELLEATGSTLTKVDGVGPVLAARLLGWTGSPARFASDSHYASYTPPPPSRSPAPNTPGTGCRAPATGSSTTPCTWSR